MKTDLAAIVARDAGGRAGELTWDRLFAVENDRRALLSLLRETRDALAEVVDAHDVAPLDDSSAFFRADHLLLNLAALDPEPSEVPS